MCLSFDFSKRNRSCLPLPSKRTYYVYMISSIFYLFPRIIVKQRRVDLYCDKELKLHYFADVVSNEY